MVVVSHDVTQSQRTKQINVYATPGQKAELRVAAATAGESMSTFLLEAALEKARRDDTSSSNRPRDNGTAQNDAD